MAAATTLFAGIGAAVAYALLVRFTASPAHNFAVVATLVFVGMLVPVFAFTPSLGVSPAGQAVLVAFHGAVAVPSWCFSPARPAADTTDSAPTCNEFG